MNYNELTEKIFDAFYGNDKDYPSNLFYPILTQSKEGIVFDQFINCIVRRDKNGRISEIKGPIDICVHRVTDDQIEFLDLIEANNNSSEEASNYLDESVMVTLNEFADLYMSLREFAFQKDISEAQISVVKKMLKFYNEICEKEIKEIYHKYSQSFFAWANNIIQM